MYKMTTQSLLIKTAYSYRNELLSIFENKYFLVPVGNYVNYPYLIITQSDNYMFCDPCREAKGREVYYVHPRYFDSIKLIPNEAVIEFIKGIQT